MANPTNILYIPRAGGGTLILVNAQPTSNPWYPKLPVFLGREVAVAQNMLAKILHTPFGRPIS